jgi:hypothetical protein
LKLLIQKSLATEKAMAAIRKLCEHEEVHNPAFSGITIEIELDEDSTYIDDGEEYDLDSIQLLTQVNEILRHEG